MSDAPEEAAEAGGLPGWVMTFADLMTLLMCFFVLLLSFSEMDVAKFKQMAGSMEQAFGVQAEIDVKMIPRGTSIIAQEFSPGTPQRTVMNEVRQFTVNSNQSTLDVGQERGRSEESPAERNSARSIATAEQLAQEQAQQLREALAEEIARGSLEVRLEGTDVVVQILEQDSFASGSALLEAGFLPTLDRIGGMLNGMFGAIRIAGHTDNIPISTSQYRSNWDLSAMRATTVAHRLLNAGIEPRRVMISGYADTQPRVPNDTVANRALNRRIDITLVTSRVDHGPDAPSADADQAPSPESGAPEAAVPDTAQPGGDTPDAA